MAKLTLDERINKITDLILKEEIKVEEAKAKIKSWNKELKSLNEEKNRIFANDFIKILADRGLSSDREKEDFISDIKQQLKNKKCTYVADNNFEDNN
jgi:hypothetical protein